MGVTEQPNKPSFSQKEKRSDSKQRYDRAKKTELEKLPSKKGQYSLKIRLSQLETEIEALEKKKKELEAAIEKAATDYMVLNQLQQELYEIESGLEARMSEWISVSSDMEG